MDVKVLKSILNLIKKEKTKNRKIDINILDNLISKFIIKEEKVVDLEINKNPIIIGHSQINDFFKLLKNKFILTIKYKFKNNINFTGNDYGN